MRFKNHFKILLFNNLTTCHSTSANCKEDFQTDEMLTFVKQFVLPEQEVEDFDEEEVKNLYIIDITKSQLMGSLF